MIKYSKLYYLRDNNFEYHFEYPLKTGKYLLKYKTNYKLKTRSFQTYIYMNFIIFIS